MQGQPQNVLEAVGTKMDWPIFEPSDKERDLITKVYSDFIYDQQIKSNVWQVLNNRTVDQFWFDSNYDFNQIVEDDTNNPVTQYSSGITRDKANTFITNLSLQLQYPSITALDGNQNLDSVVSQIGRPILRWQFLNDGRPSESGKAKNIRYTHKQVVEGTVHILDVVGSDGKLTSSTIPNEEVYIPNFYQPDVQLQSHFMRVRQWSSYGEAEAEYGELENFKYVQPGSLSWINQTFGFKERYKGIVAKDQCTVVQVWYPVKSKEVNRLKTIGKLPKFVKTAKYFNVIINGINMFPWDNLMPYYHGNYPVTKAVFEYFSPAEFYWGNSIGNKMRQDKRFLDGMKTLVRYKAKLAAAPAYLNATGHHIEGDIYVSGVTTDVPNTFDKEKFFPIPGTDKGMTTSDAMILHDTQSDLERESTAPITSGQSGNKYETARQSMLVDKNAQQILIGIAQHIAFREEARSFPILKSSFQFLPRQTIKKLSIPNETFADGTSGTLEVIFQKMPDMTPEARLAESHKILKRETDSAKKGDTKKEVYVDPDYIQNLDLYAEAIAEKWINQDSAFRESKAEQKWVTYSNPNNPPGLFNIKRAARNLAIGFGDNPNDMVQDVQPAVAPGMPGIPNGGMGTPGQPGFPPLSSQNRERQMAGRQTQELNLQGLK